MRKSIGLLICLFAPVLLFAQQQQPNIVVIMIDDLGWQDLSEPFDHKLSKNNRIYKTPNIEALAKGSTKFTNAYATPVCTPSRVSFLTGMNAAHHKVTNWTSPVRDQPTDVTDSVFERADWNFNGMSPIPNIPNTVFATPFPQLLKDNGYVTIHVGKAHWGAAGTPGANPYNLGFMVNIAGHAAGHPQSYYGEENYGNIPGKAGLQAVPDLSEYHQTDTFLTDALTLEAIKTLETPIDRGQPFFLNLGHYAVHTPLQADKRFFQYYIDAGLDTKEAAYASLIEGMDKSVGELVAYLKSKQVYDNTVVVFLSDNGGLSLPPMRGGEQHTQNLPLRAGKGSVYEGGIRVPLLIKAVDQRTARKVEEPIAITDFFPTLLHIAGATPKKDIVQELDGRNIYPLLSGRKLKEHVFIWHTPNKWVPQDGPGINYYSAIRKGDWKLVYAQKTGKIELYNLEQDIGEQYDVAAEQPAKVDELAGLLSQQLRHWKAIMPVYKNTGLPAKYPDEALAKSK